VKPIWAKWHYLPSFEPGQINPKDKNFVHVTGDPSVAPTCNRFDALLGRLWRWKKIAVLELVHEEAERFYIGFIVHGGTLEGTTLFCPRPVEKTEQGLRVGMRIGREDITFFGLRVPGQDEERVLIGDNDGFPFFDIISGGLSLVPIPLKLVEITTKDDPKYKDLPLLYYPVPTCEEKVKRA